MRRTNCARRSPRCSCKFNWPNARKPTRNARPLSPNSSRGSRARRTWCSSCSRLRARSRASPRSRMPRSIWPRRCAWSYPSTPPSRPNRHIDLGLSAEAQASVSGDVEALRVMLGNLVDNAIRYTPEGGTVDVALRLRPGQGGNRGLRHRPWHPPGGPCARVRPLLPARRHARRGSGLGLAIVKNIAERHHASVLLEDRVPGPGLRVSVSFPLADR